MTATSQNAMYRINRRKRTVEVRALEDEQLSGWYDSYRECVARATRILKAIDAEP